MPQYACCPCSIRNVTCADGILPVTFKLDFRNENLNTSSDSAERFTYSALFSCLNLCNIKKTRLFQRELFKTFRSGIAFLPCHIFGVLIYVMFNSRKCDRAKILVGM